MKGIYLTAESKQEIEARIVALEKWGVITVLHPKYSMWKIYKEILSSATILPVEESWRNIESINPITKRDIYKQGVIIQPKQ
jgi:hypothetical protein